jgi:hypothetical protein
MKFLYVSRRLHEDPGRGAPVARAATGVCKTEAALNARGMPAAVPACCTASVGPRRSSDWPVPAWKAPDALVLSWCAAGQGACCCPASSATQGRRSVVNRATAGGCYSLR